MPEIKTTQAIRRGFLEYFKEKGHLLIPSSSVIPHDDPTLLFNNAGMNQFKDVFLGKSKRDYSRAATSQKCIRAGGKHNDLENVGHTSRHLTFFEMLGNFSFGDYFKKEAIDFAWEVTTEVFGMDPDRIWPSVFREDNEAFELWTRYCPAERICRMGEKDNFWEMGDTGPCGPCSELYYDRGAHYGQARNPAEDTAGERFLEFWNLVFMQFNRKPDKSIEPLPKPSIDTGAGLERVMSLIQGKETVFETDILQALIDAAARRLGIVYDPHRQPEKAAACRVIADHIRTLGFSIADGAQPSNVDRGYVLRKILRRAVRYARKACAIEEPFLAEILPVLIDRMGEDYPELPQAQQRIAEILTTEEESFQRALKRGQNLLTQVIENGKKRDRMISGEDAFKLKDTYGFPIDEIRLLAVDEGLSIDEKQYDTLEREAKERSRRVHKTTQQVAEENLFADFAQQNGATRFLGYTAQKSSAKITAILINGAFVDSLREGEEGMILLDQTPFYAEMGGQIGDTGLIAKGPNHFEVSATQSPFKGIIAHLGKATKGSFQVGEPVSAETDSLRRQKIANNHTATHLLHWALQQVLGAHVKQSGSVVEPQRLRFDFSHHKALSGEEIRAIEDLINSKIRENLPVKSYEISYEEAQKQKEIKQFFGEKYGSTVRVIDIDYSKELCGGTHTNAVGTIGYFRITKESSIAAGIRRIEAVTGAEAEALAREAEEALEQAAVLLKTVPGKLNERITKLLEENERLLKEQESSKKLQMKEKVKELVSHTAKVKSIPFIAAELTVTPSELRDYADQAIALLHSGIVVLASKENEEKCHLMVRVSDDLVAKGSHAGKIIQELSPIIEGKGGGKANAAQAGGKAPQRIGEALKCIKAIIEKTSTD